MGKIFVEKMFQEVQQYYDSHDMAKAGSCMEYWLKQAQNANCWQEELTILNELIGFYRKTANLDQGLRVIYRADALIAKHELEGTEPAGTTWLNIATAYRAFGKAQLSYDYFIKTEKNYLQQMDRFDYRMASLHNNMALLFLDTGYQGKAREEFLKAVEILQTDAESEAELATTYVNLLVLTYKMNLPEREKEKRIQEFVDKTMALLTKYPDLPDSYYAYVCDICAETFVSVGFSKEAVVLSQLAEHFYCAHRTEQEAG